MFPLNLPVQIGGFFPCRREKTTNQPTNSKNLLGNQLRSVPHSFFSIIHWEGRRGTEGQKISPSYWTAKSKKKGCQEIIFYTTFLYTLGNLFLSFSWEKMSKTEHSISRNSFFFKQLLMHLKIRKWPKIKTQTLWSVLPLKDWDIRTDLLRRMAERRQAELSSRTACKLEYRKLQPHEWLPGQLSGHRWLFTAHWQSESLKGKEAGNLSHLKLSHLGQELPYCVPSLLTQSSVCYQKLLKQVSAFSSGSLSSIWNQSCQYPDRKTQGKGRARLGWLA